MGGVKAGNLRQGICDRKRLHRIEIDVNAAVRGRGVINNSLILIRSAIFVIWRFVFINAYYLGRALCVEYFNVLFSINSPELLELAVIDFIAVIVRPLRIVTQHFEGPWPVLIVSRAARSLGTRSFSVSTGSHEWDFGMKRSFLSKYSVS